MSIVKKSGLGIVRKGGGLASLRNAKSNNDRATATSEQLIFVLDASASMSQMISGRSNFYGRKFGTKIFASKEAAEALVMDCRAGTDFAIVSFSEEGVVEAGFGETREEIRMAISGYQPRGGTMIHTGLSEAIFLFSCVEKEAEVQRIVLMTDGKDFRCEYDRISGDQEIRDRNVLRCKKNGIIIDAVAFGEDADLDDLRTITGPTGGIAREANDAAELTKTFRQLEAGIRGLLPSEAT